MQSQIPMRSQNIPTRMTKIKKTYQVLGENVGPLELSCATGANIKLYSNFGKQLGSF